MVQKSSGQNSQEVIKNKERTSMTEVATWPLHCNKQITGIVICQVSPEVDLRVLIGSYLVHNLPYGLFPPEWSGVYTMYFWLRKPEN